MLKVYCMVTQVEIELPTSLCYIPRDHILIVQTASISLQHNDPRSYFLHVTPTSTLACECIKGNDMYLCFGVIQEYEIRS
jgi:hypothetical protein